MLGHLIRKEILDQLLSFRFLILSIVGAIIIWLSLYDGYAHYRERLNDYRLGETWTEKRIRKIKNSGDWEDLSYTGYAIHKPPSPLGIFVRGVEPALPRSGITGYSDQVTRLKWSPAELEPILGLFLPLDLGLVVQMVLSLFVLLLTYDAVCGEKEGGTLSLVASYAVPRTLLLLSKFVGALVSTITAFGLPVLLGIAALLLAPEVAFTGPELGRLGLILLTFGLYLSVQICFGLLASSLTHRAATSFVLLLTFWVGSVGVLPRLSLIAAEVVRPTPSAHEFEVEQEAVNKAMVEEWRETRQQWQEKHLGTQRWREASPEKQEAYWLWYKEASPALLQRGYLKLEVLDKAFRNRYHSRLDLAVTLARASPAFAFQNAAVVLAGTGADRYHRFFRAFKRHRRFIRLDWFKATFYRDYLRRARPDKYGEYKWDVSDLPVFTYREAWPEEELEVALFDMGMLAFWGLLFFAGAFVAMLRYDLR